MIKNHAVGFYRTLFALAICIFHLGTQAPTSPHPFCNGDLAVEFFLILNGVLLAHDASRKTYKDIDDVTLSNLVYLKKRWLRLYPPYLFTILLLSLFRIYVTKNLTFKTLLTTGIGEILMLQTIIQEKLVSAVLWFPSALLLASFVVSLLIRWKTKLCTFYLFPLASAGILSMLLHINGTIRSTTTYHFIFSDVFWRALAEMMIGCICYEVINYAASRLKNKVHPHCFAAIELFLICLLFYLFDSPGYMQKDYITILLSSVFIILIMSQESTLSRLLNNKISAFLGKISYGIYLNQIIIFMIVFQYYPFKDMASFWITTIICLFINIVLSVATTFFIYNRLPKRNF